MLSILRVLVSIVGVGVLSAIIAIILWSINIEGFLIIPLSTGLSLGVFFWLNRKKLFKSVKHVA